MNANASEVQPVTPASQTSTSDISATRPPQTAAQVFDMGSLEPLSKDQEARLRRLDERR